MMLQFILFLISLILSNETPKLSERIITETHFGYHNLKGASTRQTIEMVYAPDTTPHSYPSWPYMHVYGYDTLFYESNYYISDKNANYKNDYYYPYHIRVKQDTVIQFVKQTDQLKTKYGKDNGKKYIETLKVTSYDHYNRYNKDLATGIIVNNISSKTSFKEKQLSYDYRRPYYEFVLYNEDDSRFDVYYPFFEVKDSTLNSIKYTFSADNNRYLYKTVYYRYGLNKIDGQSRSFVTKINHQDNIQNNYSLNKIPRSYNTDFRDLFKIPRSIPRGDVSGEYAPIPDSLTFFVDSLGRRVKRKTFYVHDDCSYGGYATTDSVFNSKGQLIIEKPGYHSNGTTMGPPYTIKEFKYHNNGQISDIISDGTLSHVIYNENGQVLIEKYIDSHQKNYKYDDHGNLILYSNNYCVDCDDSEHQILTNKYEHVYNDRGLLIETYMYYYGDGDDMHNFALIDDNDTKRYLIAKYRYDGYDQIVRKEQYTESNSIYSHSIPRGYKYGLIHKLTTYEYRYHK